MKLTKIKMQIHKTINFINNKKANHNDTESGK